MCVCVFQLFYSCSRAFGDIKSHPFFSVESLSQPSLIRFFNSLTLPVAFSLSEQQLTFIQQLKYPFHSIVLWPRITKLPLILTDSRSTDGDFKVPKAVPPQTKLLHRANV